MKKNPLPMQKAAAIWYYYFYAGLKIDTAKGGVRGIINSDSEWARIATIGSMVMRVITHSNIESYIILRVILIVILRKCTKMHYREQATNTKWNSSKITMAKRRKRGAGKSVGSIHHIQPM